MSFKEFIYPTKKKVIVSVIFILIIISLLLLESRVGLPTDLFELTFAFGIIKINLISILFVYLEICIIAHLFRKNVKIIASISLALIFVIELFLFLYFYFSRMGVMCEACAGCVCYSLLTSFIYTFYTLLPVTLFVYFMVSLPSFFLKKD